MFQRVADEKLSPRRPPTSLRWRWSICVGDAVDASHALTWMHDEFFASPVGALSPGHSGRWRRPLRIACPWARLRGHDRRRGCPAYLPEAPRGTGCPLLLRHRDRHERQVDDHAYGARGAGKRGARRLEHQRRQYDLRCPDGPHAGEEGDARSPGGRRDACARRCCRRGSVRLRLPESVARSARSSGRDRNGRASPA